MRNIFTLLCFMGLLGFSQSDSLNNRYSKINWTQYNLATKKTPVWKKSILPLSLAITSLSLNQQTTKENLHDDCIVSRLLNDFYPHAKRKVIIFPQSVVSALTLCMPH